MFGWTAVVNGLRTKPDAVTGSRSWSIYEWAGSCFGRVALDVAYVRFFGAFRAARDEGMVARWSANPVGMPWPNMDALFIASSGRDGRPTAPRRPLVVVAGSQT